jgi:uncharacterized protein (TIRG00374 family)
MGLVIVERMLDLLVITSSIVVSGTFVSQRTGSHAWRGAAWVLLALLVAGMILVGMRPLRRRFFAIVASLAARVKRGTDGEKIHELLEGAFGVWDTVFASFPSFLAYVLYSGAVWAVEFMKLWLVLDLLGVNVDIATVLFIYPVSIVAGILTVLPFSEGTVGVTGVALLGTIAGVDTGTAAVAVVLDRAASSLPPLALWAVFQAFSKAQVNGGR